MKIKVLGCYGGESQDCRLTCLLVNESLALDAGCLSRALPVAEQAKVRSIVLSHSHCDHTSSLPFFIDNVYGLTEGPIQIYASAHTIRAVRDHMFNGDTWPDFTRLPDDLLPTLRFVEIKAEEPVTIDGVTLTPIPVTHPVPTFGFLMEDESGAVLWSSDTGPTDRLWEVANRTERLKALCIDTSFDNSLQSVADVSMHLTPRTLGCELEKLEREVPILLHHLKPPCLPRIYEEVGRLDRSNVGYLKQGRTYDFS